MTRIRTHPRPSHKELHTKLGGAGSIISQVIVFTNRYTVWTSGTLKYVKVTQIHTHPKSSHKNPHAKLGDVGLITSQDKS